MAAHGLACAGARDVEVAGLTVGAALECKHARGDGLNELDRSCCELIDMCAVGEAGCRRGQLLGSCTGW